MTIRDCMNFGGVVLTAAALVSITAGVAGAQDTCSAGKMTALAAFLGSTTACVKKVVKAGQVVCDAACVSACTATARVKYDAAVAKREAKGGCHSTGEADFVVQDAGNNFTGVVDALSPELCPPFICDCTSGKVAAAGTLAADESKCEATAFKAKPAKYDAAVAKRTACYSTARVKYDAAVAKREAKGGCTTTGDGAAIAGKVNTTVASAVTLIVPPSKSCKGQCLSNGAYSELFDKVTCPNPVSFPPDSIVSLTMCALGQGEPACGFGFCETSISPPAYCSNGVPPDCLGICYSPQSPISQVLCGGALQPGCGVGTCMDIGNGTFSYCNDCLCYLPGGAVSLFFCP